jgi:catalase
LQLGSRRVARGGRGGEGGGETAAAAWPAVRRTIEVARLRITGATAADGVGPCEGGMFNPTLLPDGIDASEDPALAIRAEVYAVSLSRRSR